MEKKTKKIKIAFRVLKRILTPKHIILLIILLSFNTFAWFIYARKVDNNIDVHVRSWKILFTSGEDTIEDYANIDVDSIYPGMEPFHEEIRAYNMGEVSAEIKYEILAARILDATYYSESYYEEKNEEAPEGTLTSSELEQFIYDNYPFKISFDISSEIVESEVGITTYTVNVNWPYESGNDTFDTIWGTNAYNFMDTKTTESCINMYVKIIITQKND